MVFTKKEPLEPTPLESEFGAPSSAVVAVATAIANDEPQILPRFQKGMAEVNTDLRVVLYGYGIDGPDYVKYVDDYTFVGGVCRNVPHKVAQAWAKGKRWQDDKPTVSRIYPQAILKNDATEIDFAKATGIQPMAPAKLAAMIGATDADLLVQAMGKQQALAFAEKLRAGVAK